MSVACDWLQLFVREPERRLGVRGNIRTHAFFRDTDWVAMEKRQVEPPFRPTVVREPITRHFLCVCMRVCAHMRVCTCVCV